MNNFVWADAAGTCDLLDYQQTVELLKTMGIIAIGLDELSENIKNKMQAVISRCLLHYHHLNDDLMICGFYIYRANEQAGYLKNSFASTQQIADSKYAVIGMSLELLQYGDEMNPYIDAVFLHELGHLGSGCMNHSEKFQERFNEIELDYYFAKCSNRFDAKNYASKYQGWCK